MAEEAKALDATGKPLDGDGNPAAGSDPDGKDGLKSKTVDELVAIIAEERSRASNYRLRAKELAESQQAKEAETAKLAEEKRRAALDETERLKEDLGTSLKNNQILQEQYAAERFENSLQNTVMLRGMAKFEDVDDALRLLDKAKIEKTSAGLVVPESVDAAIEDLLTKKPHLKKREKGASVPGGGPDSGGRIKLSDLKPEMVARMKPEELRALAGL